MLGAKAAKISRLIDVDQLKLSWTILIQIGGNFLFLKCEDCKQKKQSLN